MLGNQFVGLQTRWWRIHECQSIHGAKNKSVEWRIGEQCKAINSRGSRVVGGGCMNVNQFMGLRIKVENGGEAKNARQSIREAADSLLEDA